MFAFLVDIQDAEPIPRNARVRMTKHPATATEVGTRWDEHVRVVPGWWLGVESVVTAIDEPSSLEMDFHSRWFDGHLAYLLESAPDGTVLRQRETLLLRRPLRWFAKAVERSLRTRLSLRLADIASLLEARA